MATREETRAALVASIEHWKENEASACLSEASTSAADCELCTVFFDAGRTMCLHCPIALHTGLSCCVGTPYVAAVGAMDADDLETFHLAAKAEREFHTRILAAVSQPEALDMGSWHTCNTTHCRAGWVVHLAGEAGYALERYHNTALAAQLIYRESGYEINPCRFYDNDQDALADMKRLTEAAQ